MSVFVIFSGPSTAVKHFLFRKCDQNPFCKRNRHIADYAANPEHSSTYTSPYQIDLASVSTGDNSKLSGNILKSTPAGFVTLPFTLSFLESGITRFTLDEARRQDGNNKNIKIEGPSPDSLSKPRYNELDQWVLIPDHMKLADGSSVTIKQVDTDLQINYGKGNSLHLQSKPFGIKFYRNGELQVVLNERGLLNLEHWRPKPVKPSEEEEAPRDPELNEFELEHGMWEDSFDGKTDLKSFGPESIALDVSFPGYKHVYGIPEHSDSLSLRETRGGSEFNHEEPYRLFNVDIFEYETNSPMAMYGSIPFMQAHKVGGSAGIYWNNAADTYIDIIKSKPENEKALSNEYSTKTHWMSEAGVIDLFVMLGDSPEDINKQYGSLTGYAALPQTFAIGYHQCRWNYNDKDDVLDVNANFDKYNIPYDVIWLDIEYTDEKKYFTWNEKAFKGHKQMLDVLDESKRKLVAIIDPHIKAVKGYFAYDSLVSNNLAIKNAEEKPYHGHCWPGESVWVDSFAPAARKLWNKWFGKNQEWAVDADNLHIWNDMNEPSVFNGPETTIEKNTRHNGGWEHRQVHNLYGMTFHNATLEALDSRYSHNQRPFVLTRGYFAGSQRTAAMWTGDNMAKWEYLKIATPMILTSGVSGMPFSGADVGGFFGNPSSELLVRWYQAGAFYPFFRAHAHIDAKRREPWVIGEPYTKLIADSIKLRYKLLPTFYTAFHKSSVDGSPVLKPLYYISPNNEDSFAIDNQFFVGDSGILVKPITDEGAVKTHVYVPDTEIYYDYHTSAHVFKGQGYHEVETSLSTFPMLLRGGHIHARRDRERRSSALMKYDPYTLIISLDKEGNAKGDIYVDDGESYMYEKGEFIRPHFSFSLSDKTIQGGLSEDDEVVVTPYLESLWIEKIVVYGASPEQIPEGTATITEEITVDDGSEPKMVTRKVKVVRDGPNGVIIKGPKVKLANDWKIEF